MPTFSNTLPALSKHHGFELRRTPTNGSLAAIITCDSMIVCDTHYWGGRTIPCERICGPEGKTLDDSPCGACRSKQPWRTHAYVSAYTPKSGEHFIFECTANAAKTFEEHYVAAATLRGCGFAANRPKGGPNSKVVIIEVAVNLGRITLPNAPDVIAALSVIWRLPAVALSISDTEPGPSTIRPEPGTLQMMRVQPENAETEEAFIARRDATLAELQACKTNGRKRQCS